ncbi:MAG TPA: MFS transporter [Candidatus Corynebacterium gallistercoris]|uniref:MFS transporter n=1 Tax=Candidatus Corynebacterium gallistercoris TaxID=2838530 RepID=A0A9D1UQR4_9CORY|nr:MFS transporter [Candidatus Corynebacterium gallistercoris]
MARPVALTLEELDRLDSVWKAPGLIVTLISVFCAFGGWALLLPVIPLAVIDQGGSDGLAGLSTGIFMGATVLTQAFTPRLLRGVGHMPVMFGAGLLLGLPALVYALDMSPAVVLAVAAVRGVGFGAVTVTEAALIAELVPPHLVGRSSGVFGATVGIAQLLSFPLGMWLYSHVGTVAVLVVAAAYSVIGAVAALRLPVGRRPHVPSIPTEATEATDHTPPRPKVATWKLVTIPGLSIGAAAGGFAAFSTFLAPAIAGVSGIALALIGGMQIGSRLFAGWYADRVGEPGRLNALGLLLCLVGLLTAAFTIITMPAGVWLMVGALGAAALFGAGFGVVQTEALLMMFNRLPRENSAQASALWNMTFDSGTGLGAVLLGFVAGTFAYQGAFIAAGIVVAAGLIATIIDRIVGRHRIAEYGNVRETLRSLRARIAPKS